jgi:hypothetical protein
VSEGLEEALTLLVDAQRTAERHGMIAELARTRSPNVRHAITGDTGRYDEREVQFRLASTAVGGSEAT